MENRISFGEKKQDFEEKYMNSQLILQKNMEKYEEVIQLNEELKKEKDQVFAYTAMRLRQIGNDLNALKKVF